MGEIREAIYLVEPRRTPIGKFGGALSGLSATELGTQVSRAVLEATHVPLDRIDLVIFGNARQAGVGPNPARQITIRSGLGESVPAWTVNQACGSGMRAIIDAVDEIRLGNASLVLAGGTESMSNTGFPRP